MSRLVEFARWLNYVSPFDQFKPSLAKRVSSRLQPVGSQVYQRIQGDLEMRLDLDVNYERQIFLNAQDMVLLKLLRRLLQPGDRYVDCGANLGLFVLVAAKKIGPTGEAFAFEPSPETFRRLEENLKLNAVDNVTAFCKGCWHERSTLTLYNFEDDSHDTASMGQIADKRVAEAIEVEAVPLDDLVDGPVKLVKVDVEGAEWFALRGAERLLFSDSPPHLIIELNGQATNALGYQPMQIVEWILERNPTYRLHLIRGKHSHRVNASAVATYIASYPEKVSNLWFEAV